MSPSNQEILAQLEKLAEAAIAGATIHVECDGLRGMAFLNALKGADFPTILAAARRWVKIEEAARASEEAWEAFVKCEDKDALKCLEASKAVDRKLKAALKEPA